MIITYHIRRFVIHLKINKDNIYHIVSSIPKCSKNAYLAYKQQ
jgi:hypothetical protein